jgi:hypothetical protein
VTRERSAGWGLFGLPNPYFYMLRMGLRVGSLIFLGFEGLGVLVYAFFLSQTVKKQLFFRV